MVVVAAYLRCQDVQIYLYLNDWFIKGRSKVQIHCSFELVLGPLKNKQKSTLVPVRRIEFIRAVLNSAQARAFLPEPRCKAMPDLIAQLTNHHGQGTPQAARTHGSMPLCSSTCTTTSQTPPDVASTDLHPSQAPPGQGLHNSPEVLTALEWWSNPVNMSVRIPFATLKPTMVPVLKVSDLVCGAHLTFLC